MTESGKAGGGYVVGRANSRLSTVRLPAPPQQREQREQREQQREQELVCLHGRSYARVAAAHLASVEDGDDASTPPYILLLLPPPSSSRDQAGNEQRLLLSLLIELGVLRPLARFCIVVACVSLADVERYTQRVNVFTSYIKRGFLDFAVFNVDDEPQPELELVVSGVELHRRSIKQRLLVISHNLLLTASEYDIFSLSPSPNESKLVLREGLVTLCSNEAFEPDHSDRTLLSRLEARWSWSEVEESAAVYSGVALQDCAACLDAGVEGALELAPSGGGVWLHPVGALRLLRNLLRLSNDNLLLVALDEREANLPWNTLYRTTELQKLTEPTLVALSAFVERRAGHSVCVDDIAFGASARLFAFHEHSDDTVEEMLPLFRSCFSPSSSLLLRALLRSPVALRELRLEALLALLEQSAFEPSVFLQLRSCLSAQLQLCGCCSALRPRLLACLGRVQKLLGCDAAEPADPHQALALAEVAVAASAFAFALENLDGATSVQANLQRALCLLELGRFQELRDVLESVDALQQQSGSDETRHLRSELERRTPKPKSQPTTGGDVLVSKS